MATVDNSGETTASWIARLGAMLAGGAIGGFIGSMFSPGDDAGFIERFFYNWVVTPLMVVGGAVAGSMIMGNWWSREGENKVAGYAKDVKDWFGGLFSGEKRTAAAVDPADKTITAASLSPDHKGRIEGLVSPDRKFAVVDAKVTASQPVTVALNTGDRDRTDISLTT